MRHEQPQQDIFEQQDFAQWDQETQSEQPPSLFEQSRGEIVTVYGKTGTIDELIKECPVPAAERSFAGLEKFAAKALESSGKAIPEQFAHLRSKPPEVKPNEANKAQAKSVTEAKPSKVQKVETTPVTAGKTETVQPESTTKVAITAPAGEEMPEKVNIEQITTAPEGEAVAVIEQATVPVITSKNEAPIEVTASVTIDVTAETIQQTSQTAINQVTAEQQPMAGGGAPEEERMVVSTQPETSTQEPNKSVPVSVQAVVKRIIGAVTTRGAHDETTTGQMVEEPLNTEQLQNNTEPTVTETFEERVDYIAAPDAPMANETLPISVANGVEHGIDLMEVTSEIETDINLQQTEISGQEIAELGALYQAASLEVAAETGDALFVAELEVPTLNAASNESNNSLENVDTVTEEPTQSMAIRETIEHADSPVLVHETATQLSELQPILNEAAVLPRAPEIKLLLTSLDELLPSTIETSIADTVVALAPQELETVNEMVEMMTLITERLQTLRADKQMESEEAEQIKVVLAEYYEQLHNIIETAKIEAINTKAGTHELKHANSPQDFQLANVAHQAKLLAQFVVSIRVSPPVLGKSRYGLAS